VEYISLTATNYGYVYVCVDVRALINTIQSSESREMETVSAKFRAEVFAPNVVDAAAPKGPLNLMVASATCESDADKGAASSEASGASPDSWTDPLFTGDFTTQWSPWKGATLLPHGPWVSQETEYVAYAYFRATTEMDVTAIFQRIERNVHDPRAPDLYGFVILGVARSWEATEAQDIFFHSQLEVRFRTVSHDLSARKGTASPFGILSSPSSLERDRPRGRAPLAKVS
jgi:hypothetical protein